MCLAQSGTSWQQSRTHPLGFPSSHSPQASHPSWPWPGAESALSPILSFLLFAIPSSSPVLNLFVVRFVHQRVILAACLSGQTTQSLLAPAFFPELHGASHYDYFTTHCSSLLSIFNSHVQRFGGTRKHFVSSESFYRLGMLAV